jgi:hypothetical protein
VFIVKNQTLIVVAVWLELIEIISIDSSCYSTDRNQTQKKIAVE